MAYGGNLHVQMVRAVIATMILVFTTIAQFLMLSPMVYQFLSNTETQFNAQATSVEATTWGPRIYDTANAVYAALTVFAVVVEIAVCYLYARRIYYSSDEVIIT